MIKSRYFFAFILVGLSVLISTSCSEDEVKPSAETLAINEFIDESMKEMYLWNDFIPTNIDRDKEFDSEAYFEKLLYKPTDRWSFITNDYGALVNSLNGIETSFGHQFKLFLAASGSTDVIGIVKYVIPGTPADVAGIKRGDVFYKVNGNVMTTTNYQQLLFDTETYTLTFGEYDASGNLMATSEKNLKATLVTENPIHYSTVIELAGYKTGYLAYNQFIDDYNDELTAVIQGFKDANISDLVLDLRYNPGGSIQAAIFLASLLAPETPVNNNEIFSRLVWNAGVTDYLVKNDGDDAGNFVSRFVTPEVNLNLSKVYILVTKSTASASELIINSLAPYMEVILVGSENTTGKYVGSVTIQAKDTEWPNWAIQPIVLKTANVNWETDYSNGFAPDYIIADDFNAPLGTLDENMLARAIELITGESLLEPARIADAPLPVGEEIDILADEKKQNMYWENLK